MYNRYRYMHCKHLHVSCTASKVGALYTENSVKDTNKRDDVGVGTGSFVIHFQSTVRLKM